MNIPEEESFLGSAGLSEESYPFIHGQDEVDTGNWYGMDDELFSDFTDLNAEEGFENSLTLSLEFLAGIPWVKVCFGLEEQANIQRVLDPYGSDSTEWNPEQTRIFHRLECLLAETQNGISLHQEDLKEIWNEQDQEDLQSGDLQDLGRLEWIEASGLARISSAAGEVYLKQGEISLLNSSLIPDEADSFSEI